MNVCNRCLDGVHKCWPNECACTICGKPVPKLKRTRLAPSRTYEQRPGPAAKKLGTPNAQNTPHMTPELMHYIAVQLLESLPGRFFVSADEWDAVHNRWDAGGWTQQQIADELEITFERVRHIRRMPRPERDILPGYAEIADRCGVSVGQVRTVMSHLVRLRDDIPFAFYPPKDRPAQPCTFS